MEGVISTGTGTDARLASAQPVAGKTGTTDDNKDSWFVGVTPQMSVALWLGDRAPTYEEARAVNTTVASAFAAFMNAVLEGEEIRQWPTAGQPKYQANYIDEKNHIGKGSWVRAAEEEAKKKAEEEAKKPKPGSSSSSSSSTSAGDKPTKPSGGGSSGASTAAG